MSGPALNDTQLQSLEARLTATVFQLPLVRQQELLYRCAFAAGQNAAHSRIRRWKTAASMFAVLFLTVGGMLVCDRWMLAPQVLEQPIASDRTPAPTVPHTDFPRIAQETIHIELDAWQMPSKETASPSSEFALLNEIEPRLCSLTMSSLTRKALEP